MHGTKDPFAIGQLGPRIAARKLVRTYALSGGLALTEIVWQPSDGETKICLGALGPPSIFQAHTVTAQDLESRREGCVEPCGTNEDVYLANLPVQRLDAIFRDSRDASSDYIYVWALDGIEVRKAGSDTATT